MRIDRCCNIIFSGLSILLSCSTRFPVQSTRSVVRRRDIPNRRSRNGATFQRKYDASPKYCVNLGIRSRVRISRTRAAIINCNFRVRYVTSTATGVFKKQKTKNCISRIRLFWDSFAEKNRVGARGSSYAMTNTFRPKHDLSEASKIDDK